MSADYWSMKLNDVYVNVDGEFKCITGVRGSSEGPSSNGRAHLYPEDYLPFVQFNVDDDDDQINFEDFEVSFPPDQWVIHNKRAWWGERQMQRGYKMGPTAGNVVVSRMSDNTSVFNYLNSIGKNKYTDPANLLKTRAVGDMVFSPMCSALATPSDATHNLYYGRNRIASIRHGKGTPRLMLNNDININLLPKFVTDMWGEYIHSGSSTVSDPAPSVDNTEQLSMQNMYYSWTRINPSRQNFRSGATYSYYYRQQDGLSFVLSRTDQSRRVTSMSSINRLTREGLLDHEQAADLARLLDHYQNNIGDNF